MYVPPIPHKVYIYRYILDIKHYFHQISWQFSLVALETLQTLWNNPISHRFISLSDVILLYESWVIILWMMHKLQMRATVTATITIFILETWGRIFKTLYELRSSQLIL